MENNSMLKAAERLSELKSRKALLEDELKSVNAEIVIADRELSDLMVETDTPSFTHSGQTYYLTTKLRASARDGMQEKLYEALRKNGAGSLVKETVNANTLSSYVKELREEHEDQVPEWIAPYVNVYEQTNVVVKKK